MGDRIIERNVGAADGGTGARGGADRTRSRSRRATDAFGTSGCRVAHPRRVRRRRAGWCMANAGGSGFDLRCRGRRRRPRRHRAVPAAGTTDAGRQPRAVRADSDCSPCQVLVHYPVLWRAGWRGRVPLHASVLRDRRRVRRCSRARAASVSRRSCRRALRDGAVATADNLCCADDDRLLRHRRTAAHGRRRARSGPRTSHGRVSRPFGDRERVARAGSTGRAGTWSADRRSPGSRRPTRRGRSSPARTRPANSAGTGRSRRRWRWPPASVRRTRRSTTSRSRYRAPGALSCAYASVTADRVSPISCAMSMRKWNRRGRQTGG